MCQMSELILKFTYFKIPVLLCELCSFLLCVHIYMHMGKYVFRCVCMCISLFVVAWRQPLVFLWGFGSLIAFELNIARLLV